MKKHDAIHSSLGVSDDTLSRQREELRGALASAERELKTLKDKAGVHSLEDAKKEKAKLESNIRQELFSAQAELAQRQASYEMLRQQQPANVPTASPTAEVPGEKIDEYRIVAEQVSTLAREVTRLMAGLTGENLQVKTNQIRLQEARARKTALETNFPGLLRLAATPTMPMTFLPPAATPAMDLLTQGMMVKALESKTTTLSNQLETVRGEMQKIDEVETQVMDLERKRSSLDKQLAFIEQSLAQARWSATLGDRQNTSISKVQAPSPPFRDFGVIA